LQQDKKKEIPKPLEINILKCEFLKDKNIITLISWLQ